MKKHLLFNQSFGTEGSPNQTGETLTRENRIGLKSYLRRTLMLLLVAYIGIGQMWGASPWLLETPTQNVHTQDGITISGEYGASLKMKNSNGKAYLVNNTSLHIFSESTNITAISFEICVNSDGEGTDKAITVETSTGGAFSTPSGAAITSATKNGTDLASLSDIQTIKANKSTVDEIAITFATPVKAIELKKSKGAHIRKIQLTYNSPSSYTTYYAAAIVGSSNDDGSVTFGPDGSSVTFDHSTSGQATINTKKYDKMEGNQVINLGTGNTFQVGDQIILDICSSGNGYTAGGVFDLTGSSDPTISVVTSKTVAAQVAYVVVANDGIAGQTSATIGKVGTTSYIHGITVLRAASPEPECGSTAQAALTLSSSSGTICGTGTATFTVSGGSGTGALSVSSSAPSKATASISGTTVTVTGVAAGSATITVTKACDATYAEATAEDYSVTVNSVPTANAGADKTTELGEGVALAATAAASGCTGAWTIESGPNTATSQLSSTSSETATFTPTAAGTYTLRWTVTNTSSSCSAYDDMTVTAAVCSISDCGNATLTYPIYTAGDVTTSNLFSGATSTNATAVSVGASPAFTGVTVSSASKGSSANAGVCYAKSTALTGKMKYSASSKSSSYYIDFPFTVNTGYIFTPCDVQVVIQPVSSNQAFTVEITNGTNVYGTSTATLNAGVMEPIIGLTSPAEMSAGNYAIRLYPHGGDNKEFRMGANVILKGTTASASSTWSVRGSFDTSGGGGSWGPGEELSGSGTTVTGTISLSANTDYEFKLVEGSTWYQNSGSIIGGTTTTSAWTASDGSNSHLLTTEAGDYTFSLNTSTKVLTVTYPESYTVSFSNSGSWTNVYAYKFTSISSNTGNAGAWPGTKLTSGDIVDHCGTSVYQVTTNGFKNVIFTNGESGGDEKKTGDMLSASGDGKYVANTGTSWTAFPTFTMSYDANGGSGNVPTDGNSYECGDDVTVKGNVGTPSILTLAGYSFGGWSTSAGSGTEYSAGGTYENISANTTLYAKWVREAPTSVSIDGDWAYFPGQTISITAVPTGGTSDFTYQWQKYIGSTWTNLTNGTSDGVTISGATAANLQISGCKKSNAGSYRCKVSKAGLDVYSDAGGHAANIKIYTLDGNYTGSSFSSNDITYSSGTSGTATLSLNANSVYEFKIIDNFESDIKRYGSEAGNYIISPVTFGTCYPGDLKANIRLFTGPAGDYTFTVNIAHVGDNSPYVSVSVAYPTVTHPAAGYAYFEKPDAWTNVYLYWYTSDGYRMTDWEGAPELVTTTTICDKTYYYAPIGTTFDYVIYKGNSTNRCPKDGYSLSTSGCSGKWLDKNDYETCTWTSFTYYGITFAANGSDGGTAMTNVSNICPSSDVSLAANTLTKTGHTFGGWKTNAALTYVAYGDADDGTHEVSAAVNDIVPDKAKIKEVGSNITLTAQWIAAASQTALVINTLYEVPDMIPSGASLTSSDQFFDGLSANTKFELIGSGSGSTTPKVNNNSSNDKTIDGITFDDGSMWFKGDAEPSSNIPTAYGLSFIVPEGGGKLYLYFSGENTNIKLAKSGEAGSKPSCPNGYGEVDVTAGTYYLYGTGTTAPYCFYGLKLCSKYNVSISTTNVTKTDGATGAGAAIHGRAYEATFTASAGYTLPSDVTVTIGDVAQTKGTGYTWTVSDGTGTLTVPAAKVTGAIAIGVTGDEAAAPTLYTVTFNSNGGSTTPDAIEQASEDESITMPDAPTYSGYTFQGWVIGGTTYDAGDPYTPTADITAYASWKADCAGGGGGGSGATLFSQNFNSATTIYVKNTTNVAKSLDGTNGINILGSTAASQFTSFYGNKKSDAGFGLNNTNANDTAFNAAFGVYANNTGYKYCLAKTTNFSATPPTAIKVVMHMKLKGLNGQNGAAVLGFAVGSGFTDKTIMDGQKTDSIHSAFSFNNHTTNHTITSYNTTTSISGDNVIADNTEVTITWVINNSGIALNYRDPASGETELGNDKFDVWVGSTKYVAGQSANNGAKALRQLIIGDPSGKKHVFTLNDITVTDLSPAGGGCYYVTYNGNGAETGSISDAEAYASGSNVTVLGNTGGSAFTKTDYRFNGWNTSATGNGTAYAAGATISSISANVTLYAQWVADACSAPSEPTISGTSVRTVGQTITLNAACASGADASTTYTWYKGVDWATASAASPVQAALTAGEGGRIFNKASCVAGDAGKYWCKASNGDGCESHNAAGFTVTVNAAGEEHIYYYKDADHYDSETDTYYNPEGNTASSGDNKSLSSPWMICNGCKAGVDSVVAHGATYDGKGNHMNAYIKLPTDGNATKDNIKFALSAGYTGTLTIKIGGYNSNPTVSLYKLTSVNGAIDGDAITPTSGEVDGVATTEDDFNAIVWPLATAGGTYVLTVTSKTGYISQIDMTTETSARFNVTYDGNGKTGGTVPTDAATYASGATVTVATNTGDGKLVKENYTGAGWNTANNGTGTNYVPGTGTFSITANTTLYAHWTQLITLAPGAQSTGTNNAAVSWNGSVLRGFSAHTASGYALQGYYTEPTGGTKVLNADGSFAATDIDGFVTFGKWSNTGAAPTLYAQWEASNLLKWNLKVNVSETSITTLSKESAAPTVISVANMGNLTNNGSLTITGSAKSGLTSKIATTASATDTDAGKYMSVQFIVAAGYQLVPSDIKVKVQPISHSQTTKLILGDNNSQSISYTSGSLSKGSTHTVTMTNSEEVAFTGTVTLKIYVYGTAESDGYRLGTPIEINGSVEATCATPPTFDGLSYDATEYTVGASASAIEVTGAENVNTYAWKQNDVNDRSGGEAASGTNNAVSYTPPTGTIGTKYYWCEMTNTTCGITIKTPAVGIMVRNATTDPTVTWSDVKLNDATATPNYGGGNYVLRATVNETSWPGTLAASMITAPAGIRIHHVTTGTDASKEYIEFQFDVTTAFDRASNATIDFNLALPEAGSYSALNSVKSVTYNDCSSGAAGQVAIKMGATASTSKSNPQNYWETAGAGRLMFNYGSNMGSSYNSTGYKTADSTFYYYAASTGQKWMFQTYIAGVNKVRVVFRAAGTIKSSKATITDFYYNTEYFASPGSNAVSFGEVSASKAGYSSGEDGYIEFTVPEMAANSYGAFVTGDGNMKVYGVVLYSENAGTGGSVATNPAWSDSKADEFTVEKNQSDANFRYTISTTTNTLGAISYSSSNPSVAAVDPVTGEVTITATGASAQSATITATLARSGCYQGATRTYTINVAGYSCSEPSGSVELTSGSATKCESESVTLTMTGFTEGASIQWYNGESTISKGDDYEIETTATRSTLTTAAAGTYSAIATVDGGCDLGAKRTNSITIANLDMSEQKTVRKVSQWYVKNGRPTPDIALWQLGEGETFKSVAWSSSNGTGLNFRTDTETGIVYLEGKEPSTNTSGADIPYTLTLTITDACGTDHELSGQTITLTHQKNTDKHVLAFVVNGTAKGGFTEGITAAQTTSVDLYNAIAAQFDVQATNIYSTDDEQKLREYYSQYDILCITDYPNTQTKGANSKSYVDAIGALIDIRPILTMEAFVSSLSNWKLKGVSGNPKSPSTRQYTMLLQCKDHEIFSGTKLTKVGEGEDAMYRVTMVDKSQEEYKTLDANYGDGEHKANEGYQYGKKPALQGFTYTEEMSDNNMLPLGLIDDGAGNDLQVGIERQAVMEARMMVLGINSYAMERLDGDGKTIVINALKYLMKKSAEDISDCSVYFDGSDETDPTNWDNELNWGPSYASLPQPHQEVRILKECVVKDGVVARASGIKIIPRGRINHDTDEASGSLTIEPGGALIVDGEVRAAVAPNYFTAYPTTPSNLVLQSNSSAQAALILDNSNGETQATVQMYSKASGAPNDCKWQWIATPFSNVNRAIEFYYGAWMYEWDNATHGWTEVLSDDPMEPFKGYSITQEAAGSYWMNGVLASTENREQVLRSDEINGKNNGINVIGNSWTAPIQIANFEAEDFTNAHATIFILNTGLDVDGTGAVGRNNSTAGQYISIPVEASALMESTLKVIPAMQAFQVKAQAGGGSLNMDYDRLVRNDAMSQEQIGEPMRAPGRQIRRAPRVNKAEVERMHITIRGSRFQDEVYIFAHPDFTEGFDNGWDGEKIRGASEAVQLFVRDATSRWAVAAVPTFVGTYLATYKGEDNEYTISFDYSGDETLYWYDTKTDIYTEINAENTYTYTTDVSTIQTRFMITNENPKLEVPTGVESEKTTNTKAVKFIDEDKMYIFVNGKLYDATGKVVK